MFAKCPKTNVKNNDLVTSKPMINICYRRGFGRHKTALRYSPIFLEKRFQKVALSLSTLMVPHHHENNRKILQASLKILNRPQATNGQG